MVQTLFSGTFGTTKTTGLSAPKWCPARLQKTDCYQRSGPSEGTSPHLSVRNGATDSEIRLQKLKYGGARHHEKMSTRIRWNGGLGRSMKVAGAGDDEIASGGVTWRIRLQRAAAFEAL